MRQLKHKYIKQFQHIKSRRRKWASRPGLYVDTLRPNETFFSLPCIITYNKNIRFS